MRYNTSVYLLQVWILDSSRLRSYVGQRAAVPASSVAFLPYEFLYSDLDLRAKICAMESRLVNLVAATLTVPAQAVNHVLRPTLLKNKTHRVGEANRIVRSVCREKKHVAFPNDDIPKRAIVDNLEYHGASVLIEPFRGLVDVVVGSGVRAADNHDCEIFIVDTVVVDGRFQEMRVLVQPNPGCRCQ